MTLYRILQFFLLVYFALAMHLLLPTLSGSGLYLSFNVTSWLAVVVIIAIGLSQIAKQKQLIVHPVLHWLFIGIAFLLVPFFYNSPFQDHMILRLLGVLGGFLLLLSCFQFQQLREQPRQILWLILIAASVQLTASFLQIFWTHGPFSQWYNGQIYRPFGLFLQPNVMATFLTTIIAICLYLLTEKKQSKSATGYLCLLLICSSFVLPILTSLSGWISFWLVILLFIPRLFQQAKTHVILTFLLMFSVLWLSNYTFVKDSNKTPVSQDSNVSVRKDIYLTSLNMIIDKPIQGYGYGSFERAYLDYYNESVILQPDKNPPLLKLNHPHNEILLWVVEGGLAAFIGVVCVLTGYFMLVKNCFSLPWQHAFALIGLSTPIIFHALVEMPFDNAASHWHILIFLLFFSLAVTAKGFYRKKLPSALLPATGAVLIASIFVPFLVTTLHTISIIVKHETSGYQRIDSFEHIINPLPLREKILSHINSYKLFIGVNEKNLVLIAQYADWAKTQVKFKPRISTYKNLLLCLQLLNRQDEYQKFLNEARTTYPNEENWQLLQKEPTHAG